MVANPAMDLANNLNTPRLVADSVGATVWKWDSQEPYGNNSPNQDPGNTGTPFNLNLRFPGQYADAEDNLAYNNFRDYDSSKGRYVQSDPIEIKGGLNLYAYAIGSPVARADPLGLDATITFYRASTPEGHIGIGVNSAQTVGFYPDLNASTTNVVFGAPTKGVLQVDAHEIVFTITIPLSASQDQAVANFLDERRQTPGNYSLYSRNCATTVRDALRAAGLNPPDTVRPKTLVDYLRRLYY